MEKRARVSPGLIMEMGACEVFFRFQYGKRGQLKSARYLGPAVSIVAGISGIFSTVVLGRGNPLVLLLLGRVQAVFPHLNRFFAPAQDYGCIGKATGIFKGPLELIEKLIISTLVLIKQIP